MRERERERAKIEKIRLFGVFNFDELMTELGFELTARGSNTWQRQIVAADFGVGPVIYLKRSATVDNCSKCCLCDVAPRTI